VVFLNKNTSVGTSHQKAKSLQKNYEHFESVAQVCAALKLTQIFLTVCMYTYSLLMLFVFIVNFPRLK